MLNSTICILDIFSYNGEVNIDACATKNGIYSMKRLEYSVICICIPGFTSRYIDTLNTFAFWSLHRSFKEQTQLFDRMPGFRGHPVRKAFIEYPLPHVHQFILQRNLIRIENA